MSAAVRVQVPNRLWLFAGNTFLWQGGFGAYLALTWLVILADTTVPATASLSASAPTSATCTAANVAQCTEGHRGTFNDLINMHSKSLLHGIDAAAIKHLCDTHNVAIRCLNNFTSRCSRLVDAEHRKLHNLTRLCQKLKSSDLMETYSLHQRCLQSKTRKAVDECWITFHGDTDGTLSPWVHTYPRPKQQSTQSQSATRTRKTHLAVCLLHQCLEEALRTKCDDSNTAYEKQASRLVNELVAPLPPFSMVNVNCTYLRGDYENRKSSAERLVAKTSKSQSSTISPSNFYVTIGIVWLINHFFSC